MRFSTTETILLPDGLLFETRSNPGLHRRSPCNVITRLPAGRMYGQTGTTSLFSGIAFVAILLLLNFTLPVKTNGQSHSFTVVIKNIKSNHGTINVALYDSEREFMNRIWKSKSAPAEKGEIEFVFDDVPAGDYAISVMHDSNENGKLDTNSIGIPKEGFGFSNDAAAKFGLPPFEKAKFTIPTEKTITISMKYL